VIIDRKEAAYTVFASFPTNKLEAVRAQLGNDKVAAVSIQEFRQNLDKRVKSGILKDEYQGSNVVAGILALIQRYPETTIGLTWNGGVAITYNDYQHARRTYQKYVSNPIEYDRTRIRDPRADPVNPRGHFGQLLGW
jgi:hypothetical protein